MVLVLIAYGLALILAFALTVAQGLIVGTVLLWVGLGLFGPGTLVAYKFGGYQEMGLVYGAITEVGGAILYGIGLIVYAASVFNW